MLDWKYLAVMVLAPVIILLFIYELGIPIMGDSIIAVLLFAIVIAVGYFIYWYFTNDAKTNYQDIFDVATFIRAKIKEKTGEDIAFDGQSSVETKRIEALNEDRWYYRFRITNTTKRATDIVVEWNATQKMIQGVNWNPTSEQRRHPSLSHEPILYKQRPSPGEKTGVAVNIGQQDKNKIQLGDEEDEQTDKNS